MILQIKLCCHGSMMLFTFEHFRRIFNSGLPMKKHGISLLFVLVLTLRFSGMMLDI